MLASGGYDSTVALWDIVGDEPVQKLRLQVNRINFTIVLNSTNKCNPMFQEMLSNFYCLSHREPTGPRTQFGDHWSKIKVAQNHLKHISV